MGCAPTAVIGPAQAARPTGWHMEEKYSAPPRKSRVCRKLFWGRRPVAWPVGVRLDPTLRSTFTSPAREDTDPTEQTGGLDDRYHASDRPRRAGLSRCADDPRAPSSEAGGWLGTDRGQGVRAEPVRVAYPPGPGIRCDVPAGSGHRGCRRHRPVPRPLLTLAHSQKRCSAHLECGPSPSQPMTLADLAGAALI